MNIEGRIIHRTDRDFERLIMETLFNKRDPEKRPDIIVEPKSIQDVIATIKQAKSLGKKISVCSGGHSWSANHIRENTILINMTHFNTYELNIKEKTAKAGPAVSGSTLLVDLYKHNLFFPAGHCKGVCIGGYLLQGGFGWHSRKLGMACESVIGLDIVTAEGDLVHANEIENADLFWAARGSGAGFFGVVICFHLKLHNLPKYRGVILHNYFMRHMEEVYNWAYEVGPSVPDTVEFQMIMSKTTMNFMGPGIEAIAPIFADTRDELHEAMAFMTNSPVKNKAFFRSPFFNPGIKLMYFVAMTHYPGKMHWAVDNMWTNAPIQDLMPHIKQISETLPPPPTHVLWLNWHPMMQRQNMSFSMENNIYIALYCAWKNPQHTARYEHWATDCMQRMSHLSTGIQLADENLHKRTAPFVSDENLKKITIIRAQRDPKNLFNEWHSKPLLEI
jgi:FAD binding domain